MNITDLPKIDESGDYILPVGESSGYTQISRLEEKTFKNGEKFILIIYGAFVACRNIEQSNNGIAILHVNQKKVLADKICIDQPESEKHQLFDDLLEMSWRNFCQAIRNSGTARYSIPVTKSAAGKDPVTKIQNFARFMEKTRDPVAAGEKEKFLKLGKNAAQGIAELLGLEPEQYKIRVNRAGPAVCGDIVLHTDRLYMDLSPSCVNHTFMYRECDGQSDYTGKYNQSGRYSDLIDPKPLLRYWKSLHEMETA